MDTAVDRSVTDEDDSTTVRQRRRWVLVLAAWSLVVWATRIDNILGDDTLDGTQQAWRVALALSFTLPALALGGLWWRRPTSKAASVLAAVLGLWTIAVWAVRGVGIAVGDHEAAFIAVHLVLAVVSVTIAVTVLRHVPIRAAFSIRRAGH